MKREEMRVRARRVVHAVNCGCDQGAGDERDDYYDQMADAIADDLWPEVEAARADAKQWHGTYQQMVNGTDEWLGDLLKLLPGAEDTGMDAWDQIPRAIKALTTEVARLRGAIDERGATDTRWTVAVNVPMSLPADMKSSLFDAVVKAAADWEPAERDGWDVAVTGYPNVTGWTAEERT